MPKELTPEEAEEIIEHIKRQGGNNVLAKYERYGYRTFGQLENEVKRVLGRSWKVYNIEE